MSIPIPRFSRITAALVMLAAGCQPAPPAGDAEAAGEPIVTTLPVARTADPADTVLLAQALERAAELPRLRGLLVSQGREVVLERYVGGAGADRPTNIKSASKSVLSALVGIAIAEGHIRGIDQPISDFFPGYFARADVDPRKRQITVGNLLSMQSGLESTSFNGYGAWVSSPNWVNAALARPVVDAPGGRMLYSTGSTHLLSAILTRATGRSTLQYANEKLGEPLGFRIRPWQRDPQGIYFGGNDMYLTPRQMLGVRPAVAGRWAARRPAGRARGMGAGKRAPPHHVTVQRTRLRAGMVDARFRRPRGAFRVGIRRAIRVRGAGTEARRRLHVAVGRAARPRPSAGHPSDGGRTAGAGRGGAAGEGRK